MSQVCDDEALPTECSCSSELLRANDLHLIDSQALTWSGTPSKRPTKHIFQVLSASGCVTRHLLAAQQSDAARTMPPQASVHWTTTTQTQMLAMLVFHFPFSACEKTYPTFNFAKKIKLHM